MKPQTIATWIKTLTTVTKVLWMLTAFVVGGIVKTTVGVTDYLHANDIRHVKNENMINEIQNRQSDVQKINDQFRSEVKGQLSTISDYMQKMAVDIEVIKKTSRR